MARFFLYLIIMAVTISSGASDEAENQNLSPAATFQQFPCQAKRFDEGRNVCVCNTTYCDTLDPIKILPVGQYKIYTSTRNGLRFTVTEGTFDRKLLSDVQGKISLKRAEKFQTILGFGGAFTDATGVNIDSLPASAQENLLASYFSHGGIGYSLCRVPMAGTDFSVRNYTYNDHPGDVNLTQFELQREDLDYKIPLIKRAQKMSPVPVLLFASPWSSPPWTKTNNDYKGQGWLKKEFWTYWANYFVRFLKTYQENGIQFWGVTTQNEPSTGLMPQYPFNTLGWRAEWMLEWIVGHLGPILREESPETKIIMLDDNTVIMKQWTDTILSNKTAADYVSGIGFHWYSNILTGFRPVKEAGTKYPNQFLLATEACTGFLPWENPKVIPGSWERGESYIEDILRGLENGVGGWVDWNMALNLKGGPNWAGLAADSPILVNATSGEFYKQPMFYALGHVTKFFMPGSRVIETTVKVHRVNTFRCRNCVRALAVENLDGTVALCILNKSNNDVTVLLEDSVQGRTLLVLEKRSFKTLIFQ